MVDRRPSPQPSPQRGVGAGEGSGSQVTSHESRLQALSISKAISEFLTQPRSGTLIATFERSGYLELDGRIVALVFPPLLNGPLNIVVAPAEPSFLRWRVGMRVQSDSTIGFEDGIEIDLAPARVWDATIAPWDGADAGRLWVNLEIVRSTLLQGAPQGSVAHYLPHFRDRGPGTRDRESGASVDSWGQRAYHSMTLLHAGLRERAPRGVAAAGQRLAGLGWGLTPSGDDVLVGVLVALHALAPNDLAVLRESTLDAVRGRTTRISTAYVEAAARGEAGEAWHRLLAVLPRFDQGAVADAAQRVMAFGETSGADMLAGFLLAMGALLEHR